TVRGVEHAARQSYAHDVVGAAQLMNGLALLGVAMRVGWLAGSLGAGGLIARLGSGAAYLAVAAGFLAGGFALIGAAPPRAPARRSDVSVWRGGVGVAPPPPPGPAPLGVLVLTPRAPGRRASPPAR